MLGSLVVYSVSRVRHAHGEITHHIEIEGFFCVRNTLHTLLGSNGVEDIE